METPTLTMNEVAWQDAERERAFWQQHHREFLEKYADQFVADKNGALIATSYDLRDQLSELREKGLSPKETWIHFFASESAVALL